MIPIEIEYLEKYICRINLRSNEKYKLKEWVDKLNWQVLEFQAMWIMNEDDTNIYVWERAMGNKLLFQLVWWWIASWDLEFLYHTK